MQFSAFFPGLGKEFHYLLHKMGLTIGSVLEINLLGQIYASKVVSIPAVKILGDKGMVLPKSLTLPAIEGKVPMQQKVVYARFPSQCYVYHEVGHLAAICPEKEGRSFQKVVNCFRCKKNGHFARYCPMKEQGQT